MLTIECGSIDYPRDMDRWIFLDIGFSGRKGSYQAAKTSGLILPDGDAELCSWSESIDKIAAAVTDAKFPLHIMIEAPLSVAFSAIGDHATRSFERRGAGVRPWYSGAGAGTLLAAQMMLWKLLHSKKGGLVLYEAFISFKKGATDHIEDARKMRGIIQHGVCPLSSEQIKEHSDDNIVTIPIPGTQFPKGNVPPVFVLK